MADNIPVTPGSGANVAAEDVSGVYYQRVKLIDGSAAATGGISGDSTYGLDVDVMRLLGVAPADQIWKRGAYTTTQTGTVLWDPTAGKKIAVTHIIVGSKATAAGDLVLWFGANGDTTYNGGTDQPVLEVTLTPTASSTPGLILPSSIFPIRCQTADHELKVTTSAALNFSVVVYGFEW